MFFSLFKSVDCILEPVDGKGGLYLGNISAAEDVSNLRKLKIKAVLTVASYTYLSYNKSEIPNHRIIPADDYESFDLSVYFTDGIDYLEKNLDSSNVLCHCLAGVSRSATLVIAYLMKKNKWKFAKALEFVRDKRRIVHPNQGFVRQLLAFEKQLNL